MPEHRRARNVGFVRGFDHRLLDALSLAFRGQSADRLCGLAAYCSGMPVDEAAERAGMEPEAFWKFMGEFRDQGIPALYADGSPTCLPLPAKWSGAKLRPRLKDATTARETKRIRAAMFAYAGEDVRSIANLMESTPTQVRLLIDEFVLYGPTGFVFPAAPRPKADPSMIRRLSEVEPDKWVKRNASMFADFLQGVEVRDIAARHDVKLHVLAKLLRRLDVLGLEGLYHTRIRVPVKPEPEPQVAVRAEPGQRGTGKPRVLDRDTLIRQSRGVKDRARIVKLNALSLVADGKTCGEAGRFYDVSADAVRKWRSAYLVQGLRGI